MKKTNLLGYTRSWEPSYSLKLMEMGCEWLLLLWGRGEHKPLFVAGTFFQSGKRVMSVMLR